MTRSSVDYERTADETLGHFAVNGFFTLDV